jgi:hypothetical protein
LVMVQIESRDSAQILSYSAYRFRQRPTTNTSPKMQLGKNLTSTPVCSRCNEQLDIQRAWNIWFSE